MLPSVTGPSLGLLQNGPESPFGNVLGWIVVFAVVVWPILRGVLEAATQRRRDFEKRAGRSAGRAPASAPSKTSTGGRSGPLGGLRDAFAEAMEAIEAETSGRSTRSEAAEEVRRRRAAARKRPSTPSASVAPPTPATMASAPRAPFGRVEHKDLVGDPFDDALMGGNLVPEEDLHEVPSEDEVEARPEAVEASRAPSVIESPVGANRAVVRAATAVPTAGSSLRRAARASLFADESQLSRWQQAIVMREVLGPPVALRGLSDRPSK